MAQHLGSLIEGVDYDCFGSSALAEATVSSRVHCVDALEQAHFAQLSGVAFVEPVIPPFWTVLEPSSSSS